MTLPCQRWIPIALVAAAVFAVSCTSEAATIASPSPSVSLVSFGTVTPEPTTRTRSLVAPIQSSTPIAPPTGTIEFGAPVSSTPQHGQNLNLDEIAPPSRERDLILQNCGTCHSFVCAFRGQRTIEHWQTIKQDMRDKVSQLGDQDYDALFAYLAMNFSDQEPEPNLPPDLQQLGCSSGVR